MLCHQHSAEPAHAACQRCQRGLCLSCAQQFQQQLCTHCIEESVLERQRAGRRTLWLALPALTLAGWATLMALPGTAHRLYFAMLAGMAALGVWIGLRRWRRAPGLASGSASIPDEPPLLKRLLLPALAGIAFWPWLVVETLRDLQLARQLRAFVPAEQRERSFGFGEASLAIACVAAAFALGTHGLSKASPAAGKLWAKEATLAHSAEQAVRSELGASPAVPSLPAASAQPAPSGAPSATAPTAEPSVSPSLPRVPEPDAKPARHHRQHEPQAPELGTQEGVPPTLAPPPAAEEPVPDAPSPDRRFVPGSELAKEAASGRRGPDGSYVTSSGRVVIKAPPPAE